MFSMWEKVSGAIMGGKGKGKGRGKVTVKVKGKVKVDGSVKEDWKR